MLEILVFFIGNGDGSIVYKYFVIGMDNYVVVKVDMSVELVKCVVEFYDVVNVFLLL